MNWSQSYSAKWRVFRVNRKTWADGQMLAKVDSANVSRTADGNLLESGSIETSGEFTSDYYRIVMTAQQGGEIVRVDVATLLFEVSGGAVDYGRTVHSVDGHSVLYPASTTSVTTGEYAPAGVDGARYAGELLQDAINAPVSVEGSFTLNDHIVHELGSSIIDAVWAVLDAGNFIMQIDGYGTVHILPKPTGPALVIDNSSKRFLSNGIEFSTDVSAIPNRYIVIDDDNITIATNTDPSSEVSTVNRGYFVDAVDTSPTPVNSETYGEYANRKLKELSLLKDTRSYTREFAPNIYPYSIIKATIDGLYGDFRIESQTLECGKGIVVNEKASKETQLW